VTRGFNSQQRLCPVISKIGTLSLGGKLSWDITPPRSTQACISLGLLNQVSAPAGVKVGKFAQPCGR